MEKLDWVYTSSSWASNYPDTSVHVLSRPISDHVPFVVKIGNFIPKSNLFRLKTFWVDFEGFLSVVEVHWNTTPFHANSAKTLLVKFK